MEGDVLGYREIGIVWYGELVSVLRPEEREWDSEREGLIVVAGGVRLVFRPSRETDYYSSCVSSV